MAPKTPKPNPHWTTVREYVTTKDPDVLWSVQRHTAGHLRCNCPGFIFRPTCGTCGRTLRKDADGHRACPDHDRVMPHGPVQQTCKHIAEFLTNPDAVVTQKAADPFGMAVRKAFEKRFAGLLHLPPRYGMVKVSALPLEHRDLWRAFIDDLRLLGIEQRTSTPIATTAAPTNIHVRRIVLD